MICPKCQKEQPDDATECALCGIIFAKWQKAQENNPLRPRPGAPPFSARTQSQNLKDFSSIKRALKIIGLVGAAIGWYWFMFSTPAGLPVPDNAYRDSQQAFALVHPKGWTLKKMNKCENANGLLGAQVCTVLEMEKDTWFGTSKPFLTLMVVPVSDLFKTGWGGSVSVSEGSREDLAREFEKGIASMVPGFKIERSEIMSIDGLPSLNVVGSGVIKGNSVMIGKSVVTIPDPFGRSRDRGITIGATLVPAGRKAYFLMYGSEKNDYARFRDTFDELLESFRVTDGRPTPFQANGGLMGNMKGDVILGLLFGFTMAMIKLR